MSQELQSQFELPPFIPIFIGLDEHLRLGKMSLTDLGVYLLLHRWCEWRWGICRVGGGASGFPDAGHRPPLKLDVRFSRIQLSRRLMLPRCYRRY